MARQQIYLYGNTVRKEAPVAGKQEVRVEQPKKVSLQVRKNRRNATHINAGYVAYLAIAAVLTLLVCVQYLRLQSEITTRSENITVLQRELVSAQEENTTKYNAILDTINLEQIREKAMTEFGMVYAQPGQIIEYKSPTNDYVKQYEAIPESGVLAQSQKTSK